MCQHCRAAYALHLDCFKSHFLASLDADLQRVIEQWQSLPESVKDNILDSVSQLILVTNDGSSLVTNRGRAKPV
jgi:hypothetical protein